MPSNTTPSRRRLLQVAGVGLAASSAGCVGSTLRMPDSGDDAVDCSSIDQPYPNDWPLYGYDSRNTSVNPNATGPTNGVTVGWTNGERESFLGAPIVAADSIYVQDDPTHLSAYERDTGTERWSLSLESTDGIENGTVLSGPNSTPAVVNDTVYVGGGYVEVKKDGPEVNRVSNHVHLYAVDTGSGTVRWSVQPDDFIATAPIVTGNTALFATQTGTLYAVNTKRESIVWQLSLDQFEAPVATPAVDGCDLYLNTPESGLYAVDAKRGVLDWRMPSVKAGAPPAVANDRVYVGGRDGTVYAVDPATQSIEWTYDVGRAVSTASPAVTSRIVFVGDAGGDGNDSRPRVQALDAETGDEIWTAETTEYVNASPAVADGVLYVAAGETVAAFDTATGERMWEFAADSSIRAPVTVVDRTVYAATLHGELYALRDSD